MQKQEEPEERGPGASSGLEDRPRDRVVPGTDSADEGYESDAESGTRDGNPIAGVEKEPGEP